jgi:hypothetical protein
MTEAAISFSRHARDQLIERHISEQAVRRCIEIPDNILTQPSGRIRVLKKFSKSGKVYALIVVYENIRASRRVITAFVTSKVEKYL